MTFQILGSGSWKWVTVIGIVELVMVDIEERWVVVVRVQGSRWHWGEGGQHWSCMGRHDGCLLGIVVVVG